MQAVRLHVHSGPEVLLVEEVAMPVPQAGEVLIRVATAGVNYADLLQRQGTYPVPVQLPLTPGSEVAGTITALGPHVSGPPIGTRVVAGMFSGGYAEYAVASAQTVIPIPDELEFAAATALFVQGLTALLLLRDTARLQPGEAVLVNSAAGGVGSLVVQLAKAMGAGTVIGTASTAAKLVYVRELGADVAINYTDADWTAQVLAATGGAGVAVALDAAGGTIGAQTVDALAPFGRLMIYGAASGEPAVYSVANLNARNLSVHGFTLYAYPPAQIGSATHELLGYVASGAVRIHIGETFALSNAAAAHQAIAARQTTGKIVLKIG